MTVIIPPSVSTISGIEDDAHHINISTCSILAATFSTQHLDHAKSQQQCYNSVDEINGILDCDQNPAMVTYRDNYLCFLLFQPVWVIS